MKISIDDDLYERIQAVHKQNTPAAIARALATLPVQEKGRTLVLDAPQLHRLEDLLAGGSLQSGGDLIRKVESLASFEVGKILVDFDASDWDRLAQRAARIGLPVPEYLKLMLDRFKQEWMDIGEPQTLLDRAQEIAEQDLLRTALAKEAKAREILAQGKVEETAGARP